MLNDVGEFTVVTASPGRASPCVKSPASAQRMSHEDLARGLDADAGVAAGDDREHAGTVDPRAHRGGRRVESEVASNRLLWSGHTGTVGLRASARRGEG